MKRIRYLSFTALLVAALMAPAFAGAKVAGWDSVATTGGTMTTSVELVNDTERPARFKVRARVRGDADLLPDARRIRGRWTSMKVEVAPGETVVKTLTVEVPDDAVGALVVEVKVNGPDGRDLLKQSSWGLPEGGVTDQPGDRPDSPDTVEMTGTVFLSTDAGNTDEQPGDGNVPFAFHPLTFTSDEGVDWSLLGPEAWVLAALMDEAGLTETTATITGVPLEHMDTWSGLPDRLGKTGPDGNLLFLLSFDAEGVTDDRDRYVPFRHVLGGPLCKVTDSGVDWATSDTALESLLTDAGLVLPEPPATDQVPGKTDLPPGNHLPGGSGHQGGRDLPGWGDAPHGGDMPDWNDLPGWGDLPDDVQRPWLPPSTDDPGWPHSYWPYEFDFDEETVVAVYAGEKRSTGFMVGVNRCLTQEDGSLLVEYFVIEPGEQSWIAEVTTTPFVLIAVRGTFDDVELKLVDAPDHGIFVPLAGGGAR